MCYLNIKVIERKQHNSKHKKSNNSNLLMKSDAPKSLQKNTKEKHELRLYDRHTKRKNKDERHQQNS